MPETAVVEPQPLLQSQVVTQRPCLPEVPPIQMAATASSKPRSISSGHRLNVVLRQCGDPAPAQGPERAELEYLIL